ncbi:MAG: phosphate ABC transporter substrate-binding protein [bacterium]|nr:phosphate ABC transporter substrate-binding protein [bacterium]
MTRLLLLPIVFLLTLFVDGCSPKKKSSITIAGSTSVQPFIEKLADQFMAKYPGIKIDVQGGGSTAGIQATFNNTCNIGTSSRNLKQNEQELKTFLMCYDGIVIILHKTNPINDLTEEQIRAIFDGTITNWKEVGGKDSKIIPVTREEGSGTRGSFEDLIMEKKVISDACLVQDSNGSVREIIATTPQGIGYISAGLVDERVKAININGISANTENFLSHKYKFMRPFLLLTKDAPTSNVKKFIDYTLSTEAQDILKKYGLISIGIKE